MHALLKTSALISRLLLIALLLPVTATGAESTTPVVSQPVPTDVVAPAADYREGQQYKTLPTPVRTSDASRIEVTEVFWYGCSHCFSFEPLVDKWAHTLPADVVLARSPAIWHPTMELHARAFYTAKALGVLDKLHLPLYEAMNLRKAKLASEQEIRELFIANGVPLDKFTQTFNSFGVTSAIKQADARQRGYQVEGTPEMIVNGKYRVTAAMAGGQEGMLKVVDFLVAQERKAKSP
ncbi:MAG: thiol:disulfide interchange protein DsbA/DsbL [Porticoccaceae bacterium]